jgi:hypothetical protein
MLLQCTIVKAIIFASNNHKTNDYKVKNENQINTTASYSNFN